MFAQSSRGFGVRRLNAEGGVEWHKLVSRVELAGASGRCTPYLDCVCVICGRLGRLSLIATMLSESGSNFVSGGTKSL